MQADEHLPPPAKAALRSWCASASSVWHAYVVEAAWVSEEAEGAIAYDVEPAWFLVQHIAIHTTPCGTIAYDAKQVGKPYVLLDNSMWYNCAWQYNHAWRKTLEGTSVLEDNTVLLVVLLDPMWVPCPTHGCTMLEGAKMVACRPSAASWC
eukprot:1159605-Pelagomonas_calceolata.AAC.5